MSEEKPQVEGEVPAEGAEEQVNIYTTVVQMYRMIQFVCHRKGMASLEMEKIVA